MKLKNKKILLIGGCGFIGHNLALHFKKIGADVAVIDSLQVNNIGEFSPLNSSETSKYLSFLFKRIDLLRKHKVSICIQDARDYYLLTKQISSFKPDVVIHLSAVAHAAKANKDPFSTFDHNMRTLENSLDICRDRNIHFIFFSSSMVYGQFNDKVMSEETNCNPLGIYGALKFSGEKLVIAYNQVFGLNYTIVRPSALYGERCVSRRVGQIFIENAIQSKDLVIEGDGQDSLDFTYIDDLLQGIELIIIKRKSINQTFNLTYGKACKIKTLAETVKNYFPNVKIKFKKRDKLIPLRGTLDISKAVKLLGYKPNYDAKKGFDKYIKWYKELNEFKK